MICNAEPPRETRRRSEQPSQDAAMNSKPKLFKERRSFGKLFSSERRTAHYALTNAC